MAREDAFKVEGLIIEVLSNGTYRVELVNGHRLLGFVTGKARSNFAPKAGLKVTLQLSPYDLSQGRILPEIKKI
jgi:translation initiation factor IF-1